MTHKKSRFMLLPLIRALTLIALSPHSFALGTNFLIAPNGALPTSVTPGGSVTANYTVTNLTHSPRYGYIIEGLPSTVTQNTSAGNCNYPINLAARSSCNLALTVSGEAHSGFAICRGSSCTTTTVPLNVSVSANTGLFIAGGIYTSASSLLDANLPLLALTTNGLWNYPASFTNNFPTSPAFLSPNVLGTSCSGNLCVAVGEDTNSGAYGFVGVSTDGGTNWAFPIAATSTYPNDYQNEIGFNGASCNGNRCIAVGRYNASFVMYALVATSTNGGNTWTYTVDSTNAPNDNFYSFLNEVSCSGNLCIAGGAIEDYSDEFYYPLMAQSQDGGLSWTYPLQYGSSVLPTNLTGSSAYASAVFNAVSCQGAMCIGGGQYIATDTNSHGMLAQTLDGGATWAYAIDAVNGPQPTNFANNGALSGASCSASICVAGGHYTAANTTTYPFLVQSTDNGATWTTVIDSGHGSLPASFSNNGQFNSVSCSANVCVAGGYYTDTGGNQKALLVETTNNGSTWSYTIDDANGPQLPGYLSSAQFNTTNCRAGSCVAAGQYNTSSAQYPMLAQSTSAGVWSYLIDNDAATLPSGYSNGGTFGTSSSGTSSLVSKQKHAGKKSHMSHQLKKGF